MDELLPKFPTEPISEVQDPLRFGHVSGAIDECDVVDVDMEVDPVGEVVGGGEGAEAAGERVEAVEGEDLHDEGEVWARGSPEGKPRVRVRVWREGVEECGVVVGVEEESCNGEEEER